MAITCYQISVAKLILLQHLYFDIILNITLLHVFRN